MNVRGCWLVEGSQLGKVDPDLVDDLVAQLVVNPPADETGRPLYLISPSCITGGDSQHSVIKSTDGTSLSHRCSNGKAPGQGNLFWTNWPMLQDCG